MSEEVGAALAALLRQLRERGETTLVLRDLDARQALALARKARLAPAAEPAPAAAPSGTGDEERLAVLAAEAAGCTRCRLCEGRTQVVWGDGRAGAAVMVVGEAPGREEDRTGLPFVGPAGKLLDLLLASVGLPRERVYIGNVIKCRPPGNRDPMADEVEACDGWLRAQIEAVGPAALLAVGRFAAQRLMGSDRPLGRLRGRIGEYEGVPVVATYHPAFLLRSPEFTTTAWEDLQLLRRTVDEGAR